MTEPIRLQRRSLTELMSALQEHGPQANGVIGIWLDKDGHGHFHISGFHGQLFAALGLLDWIKADILSDWV